MLISILRFVTRRTFPQNHQAAKSTHPLPQVVLTSAAIIARALTLGTDLSIAMAVTLG